MRILLVHNRYQNRGGEDIVFEAERALLEEAGHEISVYERHNDEIHDYSPIRRADLARRTIWASDSVESIGRILARERPEVVHFYNTFPLISPGAYYVCSSAGVPAIQTLPNYRLFCLNGQFERQGEVCERCMQARTPWPGVWYGCYRNSRAQSSVVAAMLLFHRMLKTWDQRVDTYIALTDFSRRKFIEGGLPSDKIVVKPNFLQPDPGARHADSGYVLFVGRLSKEKGIETLLRAWQLLPRIPLRIAGDGPLMPLVEAAARRGPRSTGIEVLGWRPREEIIDLMREASFIVFPSEWYEGFPLTIVEALACGTPVIGSDLGSVGEVIRHERSGLLFGPGNSDGLARAVRRLWEDKELRFRLGAGARSQFEANYTAERNYEILLHIFERAVAGATAP